MTDAPANDAEPTEDDVFEQKAVRLAKRERLLAERADAAGGPYPVVVPVTDTIPALRERYGDYFEGGMGADAIKSLIDNTDFDKVEQDLRAAARALIPLILAPRRSGRGSAF